MDNAGQSCGDLDAEGLKHVGEGSTKSEVARLLLLLLEVRGVVHGSQAVRQVREESLAQGRIDPFDPAHVASDLCGTFVEPGFEFVEDGRIG